MNSTELGFNASISDNYHNVSFEIYMNENATIHQFFYTAFYTGVMKLAEMLN